MFGLGMPELAAIAVIAVLIFGTKRLPQLGRDFGQTLRELRKAGKEITGDGNDDTK